MVMDVPRARNGRDENTLTLLRSSCFHSISDYRSESVAIYAGVLHLSGCAIVCKITLKQNGEYHGIHGIYSIILLVKIYQYIQTVSNLSYLSIISGL